MDLRKSRANIELILLGFLVSLILKGLLDHVYSAEIEHARGWSQILCVIMEAHPVEVFVFLFALLRFMYGAYRFHELGPREATPWRVIWDLSFTVLLFMGFYLSGLLIKFQPVQFYELFAVTHAVDLIWFLPFVSFKFDPSKNKPEERANFCEEAAFRFVVLDLLTLVVVAAFFEWAKLFAFAPAPVHPLWTLGVCLIAIGMFDLWWNGRFYFHKIVLSAPATQAPPAAIYFAGPLFTQAEWRWNKDLAERLEALGFTVSLPQRIAEDVFREKGCFDSDEIYLRNIAALNSVSTVVAILDGADADSGTSWECGYAHKGGKRVIGVRTDLRAAGDDPGTATNLMLGKSSQKVVQVPPQFREDVAWVAKEIAIAVRSAGSP